MRKFCPNEINVIYMCVNIDHNDQVNALARVCFASPAETLRICYLKRQLLYKKPFCKEVYIHVTVVGRTFALF